MAVRSALGAGRSRIVGQVVAESLGIGLLAAIVGAALATLGFPFLVAALPLGALAETAVVDWTVFWAATGAALVAATAVALIPAWALARQDVQEGLTRARTGGVSGRGGRLESALVVAQVALVLLMAAGSALLIRSVEKLRAIDAGVDVDRVAVLEMTMPVSTEGARRPQVVREMLEAVEGLPGVVSAGSTQKLPLRRTGDNWGIAVEDRPEIEMSVFFRVVSPEYLQTMGIRVLSGRGLAESDRVLDGERPVVVNEAFVERYFPGEEAVGRRLAYTNRWDRIVGVVEDVAEGGDLRSGFGAAVYTLYEAVVPFGILPGQTVVVRTRPGVDPVTVLEPARRAIQAAAPGTAPSELTTMRSVFDQAIGPARQVMALLTLLTGLALVLGVVGVYGVVSHFVSRRQRDWGVRIALGMRPRRVVRHIVGRGGALVAAGVAVGLVAFLALARLLSTFLYGVGTADPLALAGAVGLLMAAGLAAAWVPARRAGRIEPARILRES